MDIRDVYNNAMRLEPGSAYDLCANRNIDIRIVDPKHSGEFPAASLIGQFGNFGILVNKQKLKSLPHTEFVLLHELGHYENEFDSGYGKNYSGSPTDAIEERYANVFAVFRLIPQHPSGSDSIFKIAKLKGIPFDILTAVLFQLSLEPDPFFRNYYSEYGV